MKPMNYDYSKAYDEYWSQSDHPHETGDRVKKVAQMLLATCGHRRSLDIGSGGGLLVAELLRRGVDAYGLDISGVAVSRCNQRMPGRFTQGSVLELPYGDGAFETIVATGCLEHLAPEDVPKALGEIYRVSERFVFLRLATTAEHGDKNWLQTVKERAWWEQRCFEVGFRKSPLYYHVNDYEALNQDGSEIYVLLEKIPVSALQNYPLSALAEERDLHMDMMREVGERSDAHIIRYKWASEYVRPGDRVLDAACGLGYGGYVLSQITEAASILGVDGSEYAIEYAQQSFSSIEARLQYIEGYLPQALSQYQDGSFDTIISFETLEHVEDPEALLREFHRLLSPGGRVIVSVPNDWSDETGEDPNPFHLHVYTWDKLKAQMSKGFMLEHAFQQIASGCKIAEMDNKWDRRPRTLRQVSFQTTDPPDSEWWLMVGMKNAAGTEQPYRESVYGYSNPPEHLLAFERDYRNPWLLRSMVEFHFRAKEPALLKSIADIVLTTESGSGTPDEGAALAVKGYQLLADNTAASDLVCEFLKQLARYIEKDPQSAHTIRWQISLQFLAGQLQKKVGMLAKARGSFEAVAFADCTAFSPSLGTKVIDAAYECGLLYAANGDIQKARSLWQRGVREAVRLMQCPEPELIGDIEYPQQFSLIVAVEFMDSATRCVKALRWTNSGRRLPLSRLFEESQQCWKWMLEGRTEAVAAQASMIRERDEAIAGQARYLDERWTAMQHMESMIRERDQIISDQAKTITNQASGMNSLRFLLRRVLKNLASRITQ